MNYQQFSEQLALAGDKNLRLQLPSGDNVPAHFHVTEVGKVTKDFVDCGGVRRSESSCVLQTLVAEDVDHRLSTTKLKNVFDQTSMLGISGELPVEFEIQSDTIQVFSLNRCHVEDSKLTLILAAKQTACLAADKCGITETLPTLNDSCCGETGCC